MNVLKRDIKLRLSKRLSLVRRPRSAVSVTSATSTNLLQDKAATTMQDEGSAGYRTHVRSPVYGVSYVHVIEGELSGRVSSCAKTSIAAQPALNDSRARMISRQSLQLLTGGCAHQQCGAAASRQWAIGPPLACMTCNMATAVRHTQLMQMICCEAVCARVQQPVLGMNMMLPAVHYMPQQHNGSEKKPDVCVPLSVQQLHHHTMYMMAPHIRCHHDINDGLPVVC